MHGESQLASDDLRVTDRYVQALWAGEYELLLAEGDAQRKSSSNKST